MISTLTAFILYSLSVIGIGIWAARRPQKTTEEIHLGNREHGVWTSALSTSASTESGFVLLGMVGMGYTQGVSCFWMIAAGMLGYSINWLILAPKLRQKSGSLNSVTIPELIFSSTGSTAISRTAAALASLFALVFLIAYVSAQFSAAGKSLSSQFSITYSTGVLLAAALIVLYAVLGGFRAVSWTDNLQAVMMAFSLIILPVIILFKIGGFSFLWASLQAKDPNLVSFTGGATDLKGMLLIILPWLMIGLGYPGQPHGISRLMATKNAAVCRWALVIATVWMVIIYSGAILLGMAARAAFETMNSISADPETALPALSVEILPGFLAGITLAAIIAAISSTADSQLLAAASTVIRDIRAVVRIPVLKNELLIMRVVIVFLAAISAFFALQQNRIIFHFVLYAFFGLGATLGPVVLYCSLCKYPKPLSALFGIATGGILTFLLGDYTLNFLISFFAGILIIFTTHLIVSRSGMHKSS